MLIRGKAILSIDIQKEAANRLMACFMAPVPLRDSQKNKIGSITKLWWEFDWLIPHKAVRLLCRFECQAPAGYAEWKGAQIRVSYSMLGSKIVAIEDGVLLRADGNSTVETEEPQPGPVPPYVDCDSRERSQDGEAPIGFVQKQDADGQVKAWNVLRSKESSAPSLNEAVKGAARNMTLIPAQVSRMPPRERYRLDVRFKTLVDSMYVFVERAEFTPTEIREAAMLAQILYEEKHCHDFVLSG